MKRRLVVPLVGLAVSFALPTFAPVKAAAHSCQVSGDAYNNNDPEALANLFTEDAVLVTDKRIFHGRAEILEYLLGHFKDRHFSDHKGVTDLATIHPIGTDGKQFWAAGSLSQKLAYKGAPAHPISGYFGDCLDRRERQRRDADLEHHPGTGCNTISDHLVPSNQVHCDEGNRK